MNKEYFESSIQQVIEKYGDLENVLEMNGDSLDDITMELYNSIHDGDNIEKELLRSVNSRLCKPKESSRSLLQTYFDDVGFIYNTHDNNMDIEFCEANRNKIIEMNLKCVVKIAKAYRNLGVAFEDLISAGNEGLCVAFNKYKPNKSKIRHELMEKLGDQQEVNHQWVIDNIKPLCKYGKLKKNFEKVFIKDVYSHEMIQNWINTNIKDASFNSVAMMWVQAYIRAEITNNSRLIKKPLSEIKKEKEDGKDVFYDLSSPLKGSEDNSVLESILQVADTPVHDIDIEDARKIMYDSIKVMFTGLELRHKRIVMQRFGIGLVRPMKPDEIAIKENISKARVSQILRYSIETMRNNCAKYQIPAEKLYNIINTHKELF